MKKLAAFDLDGTLSQSDRFLLPPTARRLRSPGATLWPTACC